MRKIIFLLSIFSIKTRLVLMQTFIVCILYAQYSYAQPGEVKFLSSIYNDSSSFKITSSKILSTSVAPISAAVPFTILITGIIKKDSAMIENGVKASVAFGFNAIVTSGMKYGFDRRRPYTIYPSLFHAKSKVEDYSFPSGHTSFAFAAATSLSLSCKKWYIIVPAYAWACAVSYSRMQLGVHYPTDVLMGALIGTASSFLSFKIDRLMNHKKSLDVTSEAY
jgi:membrane-associated phospholipid phosphatase